MYLEPNLLSLVGILYTGEPVFQSFGELRNQTIAAIEAADVHLLNETHVEPI